MKNGVNLARSHFTRFARLKPGTSSHTAGSGFRRTDASDVLTWGSASVVRSSLIPNSSADRERATLIGLTNLRTNGQPVMEPRLNRRRALFVLGKIDEILSWERNVEQE